MPPRLASFHQRTKEEATAVIEKSNETIRSLEATYTTLFPTQSFSALAEAFSSESLLLDNPKCRTVVAATLNVVHDVLADFRILDRYIQLNTPKKEDGGNFGVEVQETGSALIASHVQHMDAGVRYLLQYSSARATALNNCQLPPTNTTTSKSSTTSVAQTDGTSTEKGDSQSKTTTQVTEERVSERKDHEAVTALYKQTVVNVDLRNYNQAEATFWDTITAVLAVIDFMDKNQAKIDSPKGDESGSYQY